MTLSHLAKCQLVNWHLADMLVEMSKPVNLPSFDWMVKGCEQLSISQDVNTTDFQQI
jgi:hypothetical protein